MNVPLAPVEMLGTSHTPCSRAATRRSWRSSSSKSSSKSSPGAQGWSSSSTGPTTSCAAAPSKYDEHRARTAYRPADQRSISHLLRVDRSLAHELGASLDHAPRFVLVARSDDEVRS